MVCRVCSKAAPATSDNQDDDRRERKAAQYAHADALLGDLGLD